MIFLVALIPATALTVAGYFVLFLSNRSEGNLRTFGKYLGFWAFTLAGLVVLGAIFAAAHSGRHGFMGGMRGMDSQMHGPWSGSPRSCDPRFDEPRTGPQGEPEHAGPAQPPAAVPSPTASPGPVAPAPH
jgi:hypothetical protein